MASNKIILGTYSKWPECSIMAFTTSSTLESIYLWGGISQHEHFREVHHRHFGEHLSLRRQIRHLTTLAFSRGALSSLWESLSLMTSHYTSIFKRYIIVNLERLYLWWGISQHEHFRETHYHHHFERLYVWWGIYNYNRKYDEKLFVCVFPFRPWEIL